MRVYGCVCVCTVYEVFHSIRSNIFVVRGINSELMLCNFENVIYCSVLLNIISSYRMSGLWAYYVISNQWWTDTNVHYLFIYNLCDSRSALSLSNSISPSLSIYLSFTLSLSHRGGLQCWWWGKLLHCCEILCRLLYWILLSIFVILLNENHKMNSG